MLNSINSALICLHGCINLPQLLLIVGEKKTQSQLKEAIGTVRESAEREGLDSDILETLMHFVVEDTNKNGGENSCLLAVNWYNKK